MSKNDKDSALPRHSEPQPGASVLLRSSDDGDLTISFSDGSEALTMNRRDFMRVSGVAAATAAMSSAACREPQREIVPYVDRPEEVRIGNTNQYASTCDACPSQCGIRVKTRAGRPIKLEGNPNHPLNQGGLCGRGQASYMDLYDPDRLREPVDADGNSLSWQDVDDQLRQAVSDARQGGSVRILTGARSGPAMTGLIDDIVDELPDARHHVYEPLADEAVTAASEHAYGQPTVPHYRFDRADYVLSLGSDFLGTWLSPVEFTRDFASGRDFFQTEESFQDAVRRLREDLRAEIQQESDEELDDDQLQQLVEDRLEDIDLEDELDFDPEMNRFVAFEPAMTLTGINADDRYRVHPERLVYIALGVANELFQNHNPGGLPGAAIQNALAPFDVQSVADRLGEDIDADVLRDTAAELAAHQGRSIVIAGGMASSTSTGIELETAVNLLNAALENDGQTIDRARPSNQSTAGGTTELAELVSEMEAGDVDLLIVDDTNPVYASPAHLDVAAALENVDLVVSTSDRVDETARNADIVAAGTHFLEAWGDASPKTGLFSLRQPAILPLYENRSFEDSLLHWFGDEQNSPELAVFLDAPEPPREGGGERDDNKPYDAGPFYRYLRDFWEQGIFAEADTSATFDQFWLDVLREGSFEDETDPGDATSIDPGAAAELLPDELPDAQPVDFGDLENKLVHLYTTIPMYDGRQANNGHLQEMPEPITKHTWGSFAMVGYRTYEAAGLETGQVLQFDTDDGETLEFPVICVPGMHEDIIALPVGYGRTDVGTVGNDVGANAFRLAEATDDITRYSGLTATIRTTDEVVELPITQQGDVIDVDAHRILATSSLDEYAGDQSAGVYHTPIEYSLWDDHDFGDLKWGMSIDMTKCTGCSACIIACQEENNIPVVGRQGVIEGREMHWLRLDRYYRLPEEGVEAREGLLGDPMYEDEPLVAFGEFFDQPRVVNQPMLCQHCDKAPCESVCPVVATMQSDDGLNQMSYQRCIGTRYCSNNCPYKVRRFNWFNYAENRADSIFARMYPELEEHGRLNQEEPLQMAFNPDVTVRSRGVMEKCTFCVQRIRRGKWEIAKEGRRQFDDGEVVTACQESCPADAIEFGNLLDDQHKVAKMHRRNRAMYALSDLGTEPALAYMTSIWNTDEELT